MQEYEHLKNDFSRLEAATKIEEFDVMIRQFVEMEEGNFDLFKYVVERSNEVEGLESMIKQLKQERSQYENNDGVRTVQKNKYLKTLDNQSQNAQYKTDYYHSKCTSAQKTLSSVKKLIQSISNMLICNVGECPDINKNEGVTDSNILAFMNLIEDRVLEVAFSYKTLLYNVRLIG